MNLEEQGGVFKPAVILKDTPLKVLEHLIRFMYEGSVKVPNDEVPGVLKQANALKIEGFDVRNIFTSVFDRSNIFLNFLVSRNKNNDKYAQKRRLIVQFFAFTRPSSS